MQATDAESYQRLVALSLIASVPLAYAGEYAGFMAIDFDPTAFSDPGTLIALGPEGATLLWWDWRLILFGYYLLVAPAVVFLWYWLSPKRSLSVTLLTLFGLAYVFVGALGAAINAAVWPDLIVMYDRAGPDQQAILEPVFSTVASTIAVGVWGIFNRIVAGVWWFGMGALLRSERRWLGWFTMLLGGFSLLAAVGNLAVVAPLTGIGTMGFLLLAPIWALWLGVDLWRRPGNMESRTLQRTDAQSPR